MTRDDDRARTEFTGEAEEILDTLSRDLVDFEAQGQNVRPELVNKIFRDVHTLKGLAGMLGFAEISELSHNLEDMLDKLRMGKIAITRDLVDLLYDAVDSLNRLVISINDPSVSGLVDVAKLHAGQTILIHGGSGGVGSFAVQIAKARGARVIATASTANQDLLKQLGADVAVDYTKTRFDDVAKDVDAVLDPVGKETLARSYGVVEKGGIVMSLVARPDPVELKKRGIHGASISVHPDSKDLVEIAQLIDAGKIKPTVTQILPLSEAIAAQQQAATHHTRGKVVLRIADEPKS